MEPIKISVRGETPKTYSNNDWDWRRVIAKKARQFQNRRDVQQTSEETKFTVDIVFYLRSVIRQDLDNLAKPVLDTLFLPDNPKKEDPSISNVLFNLDDKQVFILNMEKKHVSDNSEEGADITISWE